MDLEEIHKLEYMAFLFEVMGNNVSNLTDQQKQMLEYQSYWRDDCNDQMRDAARKNVNSFLAALEEAGLEVKVSKKARLSRALEELITVPAYKAYKIPGDTTITDIPEPEPKQ